MIKTADYSDFSSFRCFQNTNLLDGSKWPYDLRVTSSLFVELLTAEAWRKFYKYRVFEVYSLIARILPAN